jgi:hypothetical protein
LIRRTLALTSITLSSERHAALVKAAARLARAWDGLDIINTLLSSWQF